MNISQTLRFLPVLMLLLNAACRSGYPPPPAAEPVQFLPCLDSICIDGYPGDWPDSIPFTRIISDVYGNAPDSSDLFAGFRLAWNKDGLLILAEVNDDSIFEDPSRFWNGDGLELFISPRKGSFDILQFSIRPAYERPDSIAAVIHYDHRRTDTLQRVEPVSVFCSRKAPNTYRIEGLIPLGVLGVREPQPGMEIAVQLYINDSDMANDSSGFSLPWYPVRDSYRNPYAFHTVRFSGSSIIPLNPEIRAYVMDEQFLRLRVLSDHPVKGKEMQVVSGDFCRQFSLDPAGQGLYIKELEVPLRKLPSFDESIQFLLRDSLIFRLDLCLLHRVYENIPSPNRYEDEIRIFEIMDHFNPPPEKAILFTGSSTIRRWYDLERHFPGIKLINRGFGGSTMKDLNHYASRIVFPYNPSRIFVYEGDNDIAGGTGPEEFIDDCIEFIHACELNAPDAEIYFLSIKPSLARIQNWEEMQLANRMLEDLSGKYEKVYFIDIAGNMINEEGKPRNDVFVEDRLHLNETGYEILSNAIRPVLYE